MSVNTAPVNFDPAIYPILSLHWFGAERGIQTVIDAKLTRYAELEPEVLEAAGGDDFWQPPLHVVPRT